MTSKAATRVYKVAIAGAGVVGGGKLIVVRRGKDWLLIIVLYGKPRKPLQSEKKRHLLWHGP